MKHLILIALSVALFSCGNKKQEIVEQIKSYKDSLGVIEQRRAILNDRVMEIQSKYVGQQSLDSVAEVDKKQSAERAELKVKRWMFESKIDSLELELKKY
jgi:hypothetical protein